MLPLSLKNLALFVLTSALILSGCDCGSTPPVDPGTTTTTWYSGTPQKPAVTPGAWRVGGPNPDQSGFTLVKESAHFAFYSDEALSEADLTLAADTLENVVWQNLFNASPPFVNALHGYDVANAEVAGRLISIQLTKAW